MNRTKLAPSETRESVGHVVVLFVRLLWSRVAIQIFKPAGRKLSAQNALLPGQKSASLLITTNWGRNDRKRNMKQTALLRDNKEICNLAKCCFTSVTARASLNEAIKQ
jgi:hypothetical protein